MDPCRLAFQGPSSARDVLTAVLWSGAGPARVMIQCLQTTGASPKAKISVELGHLGHLELERDPKKKQNGMAPKGVVMGDEP